MNWIKENKFLFGFLVVLAIGVGALGWLVLGAKGRYDDAQASYQEKMTTLNRLQRLPTFPNQKNLDKIVAQQSQVNEEVSKLASSLAAQQIPVEELTPEGFQDKLKAAVTAVAAKAKGSSPAVKVPEPKFFLGFERYETAPPRKEAAGELGRELKVIEWLCNQLIDNRAAEIKRLEREPLPEEGDNAPAKTKVKKPAATPAPAKGAPGKGPVKEAVSHEVEKHRIDVVFVADQSKVRQILNAIVSYKGQFIIPQLVQVKNEKQQAPAKAIAPPEAPAPAAEAAAGGTPPPAAPAAPAAPATVSTYIVGEEKVEVTLVLELVDFSESSAK